MGDAAILGHVPGIRQAFNRRRLLDVVASGDLVSCVVVDRSGYFDVASVAWNDYWRSYQDELAPQMRALLETLGAHRQAYVDSGHDLDAGRRFCHSYFSLLAALLEEQAPPGVLAALIGLEVFPIRRFHSKRAEAAGTVNLRNPVYLLAKLREPKAYDDPKFLPLVCLPPGSGTASDRSLFYHYRQLNLGAPDGAAVLVYPSVAPEARPDSFGCIEDFSLVLRSKPDPRARQRGVRIADWAIGPFLRNRLDSFGARCLAEVCFADLGGGTGVLLSQICKRLLDHHSTTVADRGFVWSIVDLGVRDPARHTMGAALRANLSMVEYVPSDYRTWTTGQSEEGADKVWDVILMCRLLNNLSSFTIEYTDVAAEIAELAGGTMPPGERSFMPHQCLDECVARPDLLIASNARARLRDGASFHQISLTDYFQALWLVGNSGDRPLPDASQMFFPVRRPNHEALCVSDGSSLFSKLAAIGDLVVVEDVDLDAEHLRSHLQTLGLNELAASDATDRRRMHSANLLCVTERTMANLLPGSRIW